MTLMEPQVWNIAAKWMKHFLAWGQLYHENLSKMPLSSFLPWQNKVTKSQEKGTIHSNHITRRCPLSHQQRFVHTPLQCSCVADISIIFFCNSTQHTAPQLKINSTLLQYHNAVVGATTAIRALQLTTMQMQ